MDTLHVWIHDITITMSTKFHNFANRKKMVTFARNHQKFTYTSFTDNRAFRACLKLFKVDDILTGLLSWFHTLFQKLSSCSWHGKYLIIRNSFCPWNSKHPSQEPKFTTFQSLSKVWCQGPSFTFLHQNWIHIAIKYAQSRLHLQLLIL